MGGATRQARAPVEPEGPKTLLSHLSVRGFKSHADGAGWLEMRPLTVLAGANSSGKSSFMQPLLLLKQTLDAPYDPGPLKLDGPNVYFTDPTEFLTYIKGKDRQTKFEVGIGGWGGWRVSTTFERQGPGLRVASQTWERGGSVAVLRESEELDARARTVFELPEKKKTGVLVVGRSGWILHPASPVGGRRISVRQARRMYAGHWLLDVGSIMWPLNWVLEHMIHLPGHRGNPTRSYPRAGIGRSWPGLFHDYVASLVADWAKRDKDRMAQLAAALRQTGLGWKVSARARDAASIELSVSRTREPSQGGALDLVSIADVGFGVSQTLPLLVALVAAEPRQLVYIEQPEIHLHPRAQQGVADLIVDTVVRGAQVVIETHSEIILTSLQANVARRRIPPADVVAHWFVRDAAGVTTVKSAAPDVTGALGDFPADFAQVATAVDQAYLDAAQARLFEEGE